MKVIQNNNTVKVNVVNSCNKVVGISPTTKPVVIGGEKYTGKYEVTPRVVSQELETENKMMSKNVKINEIPFYAVSNDANGNTITIGKEMI